MIGPRERVIWNVEIELECLAEVEVFNSLLASSVQNR